MVDEINESGAARYYRHDEVFWRDIITRQVQSGIGVRKFCQANGVAPSTFHKWRAALCEDEVGTRQASVSTADAMFIPVSAVGDSALNALPSLPQTPPLPVARTRSGDNVTITSGGIRIEMTGSHADRIVRHLLSRMNGFPC
jgi:hypothetical protein